MSTTTRQPEAVPARRYAAHAKPLWQRWLMTREVGVIALLVIVFVWSNAKVDHFDSPLTVTFLLLDMAPILLIALPMTLVIVTGEIDLSVASVMGLSSDMLGILHHDAHLSVPVAGLLTILVGAAAGYVNGFLVAYVGLPSLAVTIGTLALYRGIAVGLLGTTAITDFPQHWTTMAAISTLGHSRYPVIVAPILVLAVVFVLVLHFTPFGRGVFEVGLNHQAAHFSGVKVARTKLITFVLSGAVSAFAGIDYTLRFGSARGDNATGLELQVIAAVLLGGVSIFGGRGALHGVIAGVLLIGTIQSAMRLDGYTVNVINIVIGVLLVLSVMSTSFLAWLSSLRSGKGAGAVVGLGRRRHAAADPNQHQGDPGQ